MKGRPVFCEHAQSLVQEAWVSEKLCCGAQLCPAVSSFIVHTRLQTQYSVCLTGTNMTTLDSLNTDASTLKLYLNLKL